MIDLSREPDIKRGAPFSSPQTNDVTAPPCPSRTPIVSKENLSFLNNNINKI